MKFGIAFALLCSLASTSLADTAKAKAANSRGLALHKKKKFKEAAVEYRAAIAEDPNYVLAHYNLACALSLANDMDESLSELRWLADRASWDPAAKSALKKAPKDKDLKNIVAAGKNEDPQYAEPLDPESWTLRDLTMPNNTFKVSEPAKDPALAKALGASPGPHEAKCSADAVSVPINWGNTTGTVVATLRDGVGIIDPTGKVTMRSAPLGCGGERSSVHYAGFGSAVELAGAAADPGMLIVVKYAQAPTTKVTIFAKKDTELATVFDGSAAKLGLTPQGNLVYKPMGPNQTEHVLHWDAKAFKYVE